MKSFELKTDFFHGIITITAFMILIFVPVISSGGGHESSPVKKTENIAVVEKCTGNNGNHNKKEYVKYSLAGGKLHLAHMNVMYNCCPDKIYGKITIKTDKIKITEKIINGMCNCICPYNLTYEIEISDSRTYAIELNNAVLKRIDLSENPEGIFYLNKN